MDDGFTLLKQPQCEEVKFSDVEQEIAMEDIGLKFIIPAGAVSENRPTELSVYPVACGNVTMPADCASHSPLYIIKPVQMEKEIKIRVEHNCNLESEEDCDNMVFLGVDSQPQPDGTYVLKQIKHAKIVFNKSVQFGEIILKELQPLKIGRKCTPNNKGMKNVCTYLRSGLAVP